MMSCLEFGGQRWGWHSSLFSVPSIFQDIECSEAEADVAGTTMAIYTVQAEGDDHDGPGGLFADVGMVLEGVKVLNNLKSINHACVMLYGLIYALNLSYPKNLKYTFEAYQKILMDLESSKPSPKYEHWNSNCSGDSFFGVGWWWEEEVQEETAHTCW